MRSSQLQIQVDI
ncbi:hypothetical protein BpHYR1_031727 [Brachionus plicatilis]|uniref:Uncharacterized protein n=1 Tax=Brachionus plicatilis TaxID=10195 RepID=A0A3M7R1P9_BRAPC|nr:hypothetical protein BpHYR1_031727 [Brachionus plicatilis]